MSRILTVTFLLALGAACTSSPGEGKPRATVEDVPVAPPAPAASTAAADAGGLPVPALEGSTVLEVDRASSTLGALGAKITAKHPIDFKDFGGKVALEGENVVGVSFAAKIATLESDHPKLTIHLVDADFLDAATFPHATFVSTGIIASPTPEGATHSVSGDLTIRGATKRVSFPATITVSADKVMAKTEFVINRKDFGVVYPGKPDDLVQDDVLMKVDFVAKRG